MKVKLTKKPDIIEAEQFIAAIKPWPKGVEEVHDGFIIRINPSLSYIIEDGDWIVHEEGETALYKTEDLMELYDIVEIV